MVNVRNRSSSSYNSLGGGKDYLIYVGYESFVAIEEEEEEEGKARLHQISHVVSSFIFLSKT